MPYIDLVNEILEYYVAADSSNNNGLENYRSDTGDSTTPELLAEPQNVIAKAYDDLKDSNKALYPLLYHSISGLKLYVSSLIIPAHLFGRY